MSYSHINSEDRIVIATLLDELCSKTYIARRLGVDRSSISREIKRNSARPKPKATKPITRPKILDIDARKFRGRGFSGDKYKALNTYNKAIARQATKSRYYYAGLATKSAKTRRELANQQRLRLVHGSDSFMEKYVLEKLTGLQWSPEQIAGRLFKDYSIQISPQTVYDYLYNSDDKQKLVKHLRHHGNRYRRKHGTVARVKNQQNRLPSIHARDAVVETRTRLNDYEGDTVVGLDSKDRLLTYVDRASGECIVGLVLGFNATKITTQTVRLLNDAGSTGGNNETGTITYDRGIEFADYESIQRQTKATVYFADAYSSYQRGSNENLNGLLRQYFPKRSDFKQLTQVQVTEVQNKLNNRPRKRYNYRTPVEQRAYLLNLQIVALRD